MQKGAKDGISNGDKTIYCEGNGSKRRAGGQVIMIELSLRAVLRLLSLCPLPICIESLNPANLLVIDSMPPQMANITTACDVMGLHAVLEHT